MQKSKRDKKKFPNTVPNDKKGENQMRKKLLTMLLGVMMSFSLAGCGNDIIIDVVSNEGSGVETESSEEVKEETKDDAKEAVKDDSQDESGDEANVNPAGMKAIALEDLKIGVLYIGSASDTSGYTYAHELGIQGMVSNLGLKENQVVRKENIDDGDDAAVKKALEECIAEGCNVLFTTSWGYMDETEAFANEYPDVYFAHGTGYKSNGKNFTNYFGRIYQARYLSGIVAGLKTKSNKIGYVSAMGSDNSECTGGIDAFAMGVELVNPNAKVLVAVTNSWFSPDDEQAASDALIAQGCDVLSQHVDTTAPQTASQANGTWAIGYNSDMSKETPDATLTSVIWNWSAYYTSYVNSVVNATYDGSNYYGGMSESLIGLTDLSSLCEDGTSEKVLEMQQKILKGEFNVFDGVITTNDGTTVGEEGKTLDDATITGGINWYYKNVEVVEWK